MNENKLTNKWNISVSEQEAFEDKLADHLAGLRAHLGISQDELARLIGFSRQTYSAVESKRKRMTWSIFISLIFLFDSVESTHQMIRVLGIYPDELIRRINDGRMPEFALESKQDDEVTSMLSTLDEQGKHAVKTVMLLEYARCNKVPSDRVIKAFDGTDYSSREESKSDDGLRQALRNLKNRDS